MKGADLKDLLRREGVILSQLAEDLGMSQQNLSAAFTRDDVKSGFLEKDLMNFLKFMWMENELKRYI